MVSLSFLHSEFFKNLYSLFLSIVADTVLFNSKFNLNSFLESIPTFFKLQPDYRPKNLQDKIVPKCKVLYFPISIEAPLDPQKRIIDDTTVLHIVWPHRWYNLRSITNLIAYGTITLTFFVIFQREHDKGPETFFAMIDALCEKGCRFRLSVVGEQFSEIPAVFEESRLRYEKNENCEILDWGFVSRERFMQILSSAHVVVSTALHEFFGVSM